MSRDLAAALPGNADAPIGTDNVAHDQVQHAINHIQVPQAIRVVQSEGLGNADMDMDTDTDAISPKQPNKNAFFPPSLETSPPTPPTPVNKADRSVAIENQSGDCATFTSIATETHELENLGHTHTGPVEHLINQIAPPPSIVPPSPRDTTPSTIQTPISPTINASSPTTEGHYHHSHSSLSNILSSLHKSNDNTAAAGGAHEGKMLFGHTIAGTAAHRRRSLANTSAITNYEADLTSRDRAKQKEAVKKFLSERVRDNWQWEWPRPEPDSTPEETPSHEDCNPIELEWKERDEWLSGGSDSEPELIPAPFKSLERRDSVVTSPFRFESPDGVGETIKKTEQERKIRRKKRLREEMAWNDGVRCFMERRDAWTGARHVTRHMQIQLAQRASMSSEDGGSSTAIERDIDDEDNDWEDEDTEIPIAPPLIPATNAMRASIKPDAYNTIYDKVILQQLTPSCPMNLKDVTRSCVQGWKRDGEWPPKSGPIEPPKAKKSRRLSVAGIFGRDKEKVMDKKDDGTTGQGGIRKSLQRILSLGKEHGNGHRHPAATNVNGDAEKPKGDGVGNAA
ncbi:hypothetical protein G7Y89_g2993 [Cudoniella acicularis]|uniref:Gag1-like clamp domain-containing protein n=1 Tax=Cudoniella acicularis TaxID=354080 RepID=A0A8H4RTH0_9HELO|nr:hypothetical protein G7Y89_g2993 [Cudoniella acicularis]